MKIAGITYESFVDGPGLRVVIFAQGCDLGCKNCHNPGSHSIDGGEDYTPRDLVRKIKKASKGKKIRGITFSGGEPSLQAGAFAEVARLVKPLGWDVTMYSGHIYEGLIARRDEAINELLSLVDYLVDGPYIEEMKSLDVKFRGSNNQRIIDMAATREKGEIVEWIL